MTNHTPLVCCQIFYIPPVNAIIVASTAMSIRTFRYCFFHKTNKANNNIIYHAQIGNILSRPRQSPGSGKDESVIARIKTLNISLTERQLFASFCAKMYTNIFFQSRSLYHQKPARKMLMGRRIFCEFTKK